jgi:CheY-like chemotaxis protein
VPLRARACNEPGHESWLQSRRVRNYFVAGQDLVTWEIVALGPDGTAPFRLDVRHPGGIITEHFDTVDDALLRQAQLEALIVAARGAGPGDPGRMPPAGGGTGQSSKKEGPTILVVDDDVTVTETFATALNREGFNVRTAVSAETGLREAKTHRADAIILDLRMPLINGLGFLYRLRTSHEHRSTPVAVVTGAVVDDTTAAELVDLGAELRFKPLWLEEVVQLAHRLVERTA